MTKKEWTIIGVAGIVVVVVCVLLGCLILVMLTTQSSRQADQVARPTPTLAVLAMTIDDIEHCCKDMTKIQEKEYLLTLVGKRVNWQGTVDDVQTDGTIWVKVSSTRIEMRDAPSQVAAKLSKGQSIDFYAIITKAENSFLLPGVQLRFESLNTNAVAPNASPTQKATSTPIPLPSRTSTVSLTPTRTPTLNAAEQIYEYSQWAQAAGTVLANEFQLLDENLTQLGNNPALINDESWRSDTALFMKIVKQADAEIESKKPPPLFASVHTDFASAAQHFDKAMDYLATALDKHDASKLSQASQEMKTGNDLLNRATQKLKQIKVP